MIEEVKPKTVKTAIGKIIKEYDEDVKKIFKDIVVNKIEKLEEKTKHLGK